MKNIKGPKMSTSQPKSLNLYQKLVEVRKKALYVAKGESGHRFKYAGTAELIAAVRPAMDELGVLLIPNMESFELVNGKTIKVEMSYTWINAENPVEQLRTSFTFYEDKMTGCQAIGSVLTYAERYFLYKSLQVATDDEAPEQFYAQHGLTPFVETEQEQQPAQSSPPKKIDFSKPFELCEKSAHKFWEKLRKTDETRADWVFPEELPHYIYFNQQRMKERDIFEIMGTWLDDVDSFQTAFHTWANSKQAKYDIEQMIMMRGKQREAC